MVKSWLNLEEKVVIVTGGANGIGNHIAEGIKNCGAKVIICDLNVKNRQKINNIECIQCDVTKKDSVDTMVKTIYQKYGKIDALVNNAGVNKPQLIVDIYEKNPIYEIDEKSFDFTFDVNVKGVLFCTQAVVKKQLKQGKGVIINISSESGMEGSAGQSIYAATKSAVNCFTRSWAKELGIKNIRVVGVAPGIMEKTNMRTEKYNEALAYTRGIKVDEISTDYTKSIPLARAGKLNEVADLVSYLISDRADYITGTTINITGGKSRG
ncbi:MAG: SDR family oxidoreductase [Firmicutes bacterium]|jgi:sorbitol-6-phosphate 2-dehydrogenase|nr:SDR family oxidoreductase [Bacillota bacterium]